MLLEKTFLGPLGYFEVQLHESTQQYGVVHLTFNSLKYQAQSYSHVLVKSGGGWTHSELLIGRDAQS